MLPTSSSLQQTPVRRRRTLSVQYSEPKDHLPSKKARLGADVLDAEDKAAIRAKLRIAEESTATLLARSSVQVANVSAAPGTPTRRRTLNFQYSEPKEDHPERARRRADAAAAIDAEGEAPARTKPRADDEGEFASYLDRCGANGASRARLLPLLRQCGLARAGQVMALWTFLGDGAQRSTLAPQLEVWGPAGAGKTLVVSAFLRALEIRHVRLNCACFISVGDLLAHLVEQLQQIALEAAKGVGDEEHVKALEANNPSSRQLRRGLDRLEAALSLPLDVLFLCGGTKTPSHAGVGASGARRRVAVVFDNCQELPRLGPGILEQLLGLPETLQNGAGLSIVMMGRLPLSFLGLLPAREPPVVEFTPYTNEELEALLVKLLSEGAAKLPVVPSAADIQLVVRSGLMAFAAQHLSSNVQLLHNIGKEVLQSPLVPDRGQPADAAATVAMLQRRVTEALQRRFGLCDLGKLLGSGRDGAGGVEEEVAARATVKQMVKAEKRLVVAAYLAAYVPKEEDIQLFVPEVRKHRRQIAFKKAKRVHDDLPAYKIRAPQAVPLIRLVAIYHRLARQPHLLGPMFFEHLMNLRQVGLLRFTKDHLANVDKDPKVVCLAELPLVQACAVDLNVDLAEYLTKY